MPPFNLEWGSKIISKLKLTNNVGDSLLSEKSNYIILLTKPSEPTNPNAIANLTDNTRVTL